MEFALAFILGAGVQLAFFRTYQKVFPYWSFAKVNITALVSSLVLQTIFWKLLS